MGANTVTGPAPTEARPSVSYVVSRFPKLTETFILQEILAMDRLGANVHLFSLLRGHERTVQPEADRVVSRVRYGTLLSSETLRAHWFFLSRRPFVYIKALGEAIAGTWRSANYLAGALLFFPKAVTFAFHAQSCGVRHVHAQFANHAALVALVIFRLTGIPFSFTARGSDIHVDRTMLRRKVAAASFVIAVSRANREVIAEECGALYARKIHVVYGGINTRLFAPDTERPDPPWLRIVCVARFEEVKGHATLIEACAELERRGIRFQADLIGDGELRPRIEAQILASGLSHRVTLHGAATQIEVREHLAVASVFVLATVAAASGKREGIPNVLKEAMACALPVVASDISGIPELVEHGRTGLLVEPGDVGQLADALEQLAGDVDLRRDLGQTARRTIQERFDVEVSTRRRAELFFGGWPDRVSPAGAAPIP